MELMPKLRAWVGKPSARALAALALMLLTGLVFNADGAFLKPGTHADMLRHISRHAILACGMTLVIVAGGIDLSVGSVLGLSAVCFALLTMQLQLPAAVAIAACMAVGCCCGVVSGVLIGRFRIGYLARREMESALARFDKIDLVYAHNDPGAHGAYLAAKAAGREKGIIFVGIDGLAHEGQVYVKQGLLSASFEYPTGGREAVDAALKLLKGGKVEKNITLSSRVFTAANIASGGEVLRD